MLVVKDLWKYVDPGSNEEYKEAEIIRYDTIKPGATLLRELSIIKKTLYINFKASAKSDRQ
jgi:hypothetical protein